MDSDKKDGENGDGEKKDGRKKEKRQEWKDRKVRLIGEARRRLKLHEDCTISEVAVFFCLHFLSFYFL